MSEIEELWDELKWELPSRFKHMSPLVALGELVKLVEEADRLLSERTISGTMIQPDNDYVIVAQKELDLKKAKSENWRNIYIHGGEFEEA